MSELMVDHTNRTENSLVLAQGGLGRALRSSQPPVSKEHSDGERICDPDSIPFFLAGSSACSVVWKG